MLIISSISLTTFIISASFYARFTWFWINWALCWLIIIYLLLSYCFTSEAINCICFWSYCWLCCHKADSNIFKFFFFLKLHIRSLYSAHVVVNKLQSMLENIEVVNAVEIKSVDILVFKQVFLCVFEAI